MMTMADGYNVLSREYLLRKPWMTVRADRLQLPNGVVIPEYFVQEYPDWVNVIAITEDGEFVMERQYRHGVAEMSWELPCGVMEPHDPSPLEAARRELLEETGFGGGQWELFETVCVNPANTNNRTYCFIARGVSKIDSQHLDETECLEVHLMPRQRVLSMLRQGMIIQALHAAPLWKYFWMEMQDAT